LEARQIQAMRIFFAALLNHADEDWEDAAKIYNAFLKVDL